VVGSLLLRQARSFGTIEEETVVEQRAKSHGCRPFRTDPGGGGARTYKGKELPNSRVPHRTICSPTVLFHQLSAVENFEAGLDIFAEANLIYSALLPFRCPA
jgi:hypothetical protein